MFSLRWLAWRFMLKGTERGTFSAMTLFAWLAIGIGVGAMASLLSVMYGFETSLRDRVLTAYPHLMLKPRPGVSLPTNHVEWTQKLSTAPGLTRVVPYLESEMIVQSDRRALGSVVWGVPEAEIKKMQDQAELGAKPNKPTGLPRAILGSELAARLGAYVGETVKLISPVSKGGALGAVPKADLFEVVGLYTSGHYDFDQQYLYLQLEDAQDLLKKGDVVSGWHLWTKSAEQGEVLRPAIQRLVPAEWEVQSWSMFNSALFHSLKLEQYAMFTILCFAILIAVLNIVITLMMNVSHKRKNIGVLRALGASKVEIRKLFLWQGMWLGGVGIVIGAFIFVVAVVYLRFFSGFLLPEFYYDRTIPVEIRPWALFGIFGVSVVLIFLATVYPATRAAKLDPIEAIRE